MAVLSVLLPLALGPVDRDVIREEAKLLALRLLLEALFNLASFKSPPVLRPVGCNLPALVVGCRLPDNALLLLETVD